MLIIYAYFTLMLGLAIILITPKSKSIKIKFIALACTVLTLCLSMLILLQFQIQKLRMSQFYYLDLNLFNNEFELIIGLDGYYGTIFLFSNFFTFLFFLGNLRDCDFRNHALILLSINIIILIISCIRYYY